MSEQENEVTFTTKNDEIAVAEYDAFVIENNKTLDDICNVVHKFYSDKRISKWRSLSATARDFYLQRLWGNTNE